jgi:hypothetical protein
MSAHIPGASTRSIDRHPMPEPFRNHGCKFGCLQRQLFIRKISARVQSLSSSFYRSQILRPYILYMLIDSPDLAAGFIVWLCPGRADWARGRYLSLQLGRRGGESNEGSYPARKFIGEPVARRGLRTLVSGPPSRRV